MFELYKYINNPEKDEQVMPPSNIYLQNSSRFHEQTHGWQLMTFQII